MAGKENDDFELNLKDADGGWSAVSTLCLPPTGTMRRPPGGNGNADDDDDFIDFNDFSIDDLDTALSQIRSFKRRRKIQTGADVRGRTCNSGEGSGS